MKNVPMMLSILMLKQIVPCCVFLLEGVQLCARASPTKPGAQNWQWGPVVLLMQWRQCPVSGWQSWSGPRGSAFPLQLHGTQTLDDLKKPALHLSQCGPLYWGRHWSHTGEPLGSAQVWKKRFIRVWKQQLCCYLNKQLGWFGRRLKLVLSLFVTVSMRGKTEWQSDHNVKMLSWRPEVSLISQNLYS